GPDRICDLTGQNLRCWKRPTASHPELVELRDAGWYNPLGIADDAWFTSGHVEGAQVGGTFACLVDGKHDLLCVGDNTFGQLGVGDSTPMPVPPLLNVAPATFWAIGTWHGCVLRTARTLVCWGRDDFDQLGIPATDRCTVGGKSIPCVKTPHPVPFTLRFPQ